VSDGAGGAIVGWQDDRQSPGHTRLFGQRVSARGSALWAANGIPLTHAARTDERAHVLAADGNGGAYVAWESSALRTPTAVFVQRVDKAGRTEWPVDAPVVRSGGGQSTPALTTDEKGDAWLAWIDSRAIQSQSVGVYAQRLSRAGTPELGWPDSGAAVCTVPSRQRAHPRIVTAGADGAYVAWLEDLAPRATRITRLGVVPASWPAGGVQLSDSPFPDGHFALAPADRGRAIVSWSEGRPPTAAASLVRAQLLSPDGVGAPPRQPRQALPASVTSATGVEFALRGFQPNPVSGVLAIAFALPDGAPARLELFDITGRRRAISEVGSLGAGTHVVRLGEGRGFAAGLYFVRLTRGDVVLSSRGLVVR
jgi:hypothetical protein